MFCGSPGTWLGWIRSEHLTDLSQQLSVACSGELICLSAWSHCFVLHLLTFHNHMCPCRPSLWPVLWWPLNSQVSIHKYASYHREQRSDHRMDLSEEFVRCSVFFCVTVSQVWPTWEDVGEAQENKVLYTHGSWSGVTEEGSQKMQQVLIRW